jgi:Lysozyme like domain
VGELLGTQLQPRDIAKLAYDAGIKDAEELVTSVAVCLAESQGYDEAFNDNFDAAGDTISRDVGLWQINIPASEIGTPVETALHDHVANATAMAKLHAARGWQPWVAFDTTAYLHDSYLGRAVRGVANFLGDGLLQRAVATNADGTPYVHRFTTPVTDFYFRYADAVVGIAQAMKALGWSAASKTAVTGIHQHLAATEAKIKAGLPS